MSHEEEQLVERLAISPTRADGKPVVREKGRRRRQMILEAVLRVIRQEGVRAVRHRTVAREAQVPLAATTYYFTDIPSLLKEAFAYWQYHARQRTTQILTRIRLGVTQISQEPECEAQVLHTLVEWIADFVESQVVHFRADRELEMAFNSEALRDEELREQILVWRDYLIGELTTIEQALGSSAPDIHARAVMALIRDFQLEALIRGRLDRPLLERCLQRHVQEVRRRD